MVLKSNNKKDIYANIICMKDIKGREYNSDILNLDVYDEKNEKYTIGHILGESLELAKSFPEYKKRTEDLEKLNEKLVLDNEKLEESLKELSENCQTSFESLKQINKFQSEIIDNLNDKISILVQRLFVLENKTKLL